MKNTAKYIAINVVVAGLYIVLCMPFGVLSVNSFIQIRPAEALAILPALMPHTVLGLAVGCAVSNTLSPFGLYDVVLGTLVTILAGYLTSTKRCRKIYLAPLPPIILNATLMPLIWIIGGQGGNVVYIYSMLSMLLTQSLVLYGLGMPLYIFAKHRLLPAINNH